MNLTLGRTLGLLNLTAAVTGFELEEPFLLCGLALAVFLQVIDAAEKKRRTFPKKNGELD